ncbi:MAG: hypothetical protein ACYDDO_00035 [Acidiferrobacterales bacterium]
MSICRLSTLISAFSLVCFSAATRSVFADSVSSQTAAGTGTFSEALSENGQSKNNIKTGNGLDWNLSGETYRVKTTTPITKKEIVDATNSVGAGLGWDQSDWELGADLSYSRTPAEALRSYGPDAYLGYTFANKNRKGDDSTPSLELKGTWAAQRYTEDFSRLARAVETNRSIHLPSVSVTQSAASLEAVLNPANRLALSAAYTAYSYDRNIKRFARYLDSTRAVLIGLSRLSSTVSGFPSHMTETSVTVGPHAKWTVEFDGAYIISAVDSSITHTARALLSRDISNWTVGIGVERDSVPVTGVQNLGLLNVSASF